MPPSKSSRRKAIPITGTLSAEADSLVKKFKEYLCALEYAEASIGIYQQHINRFLLHMEQQTQRPFDPTTVTEKQIKQLVFAKVSERQYSLLTAQAEVKVIRLFFTWLHETEVIKTNPAAKITAPPGRAKAPSPNKKEVDLHITMTQQLYDNLMTITPPGQTVQDTIRSACREKLDRRADVVGSKRHFTGQFREEMEELRATTEFLMTGQIMLLAEIGSMLILSTGTIPEEDWNKYDTSALLEAFQDLVINYGDSTRFAFISAVNRARTEANMAASNPVLEEAEA